DWITNKVGWYENTDGLGNFGPENVITNEANSTNDVVTADLDNDGDTDVVSISYLNYIAWYENIDGIGNFSSPIIIFSTSPNFAYKLFVEDLDADGDFDIIASLFDRGEVIWLENDGTGNFVGVQVIYEDEFLPIGVIADDFNGDSKIDLAAGIHDSDQIIWFENRGPLGIEENTTHHFTFYPNPTNGLLSTKSTSQIAEITVYNNLGQLLSTFENKDQIDIS